MVLPTLTVQGPCSVPASLQGRSMGRCSLNSSMTTPIAPPSREQRLQQRCRQHWRQQRERQQQHICASYNTNPQNVEQCQAPPAPEYSPEQAVAIQLEALQRNDEPWGNHGVQTAYEFALDVGGLDPSLYFGFPKDLYHFDHFMGMFSNRLPELVNNEGFEVCSVEEREGDDEAPPTAVVTVAVQPAAGKRQQQQQQQGGSQPQRFEFQLRRKLVGARKGALMTFMVRRVQE